MSKTETNPTGTIAWIDLTVSNAEEIRDFYSQVVGWHPEPVDMGDFDDFNMCLAMNGKPAAGICHARGMNADLPPVWLIYLTVEDVDAGADLCVELGGKLIIQPRDLGGGRFCVIQDPAGAIAALYAPLKEG